ncbi:MAG: GT4 family glycosyltransferase PelF [Candidatus Omnitrophota bacterium]|nr:GT4 family glycosyltransferase PelF [Candidatus Omnitrophota bacterium]
MNILQVLPELNVGGVETGTVDLARYFVSHSHKVVVVSNGGELVKDLEKINVRHYHLPVHKKSLFTMIRMVKELIKIIKSENIEIVHARSRVPAWISFFACRKTNTAFITTCHGYYTPHLLSRVMGWPKLVICPSLVIARHMIESFNVPHERIRIIPRSVDLERFTYRGNEEKTKHEFIVGIVGRITPLKGHSFFLRAMAKVVRTLPFMKIWIIGSPPENKPSYKEELEVLVKRFGLSNYVEFLGNRRDIPDLIAKMNVLVLATISEEAFGRVILEAQAVGTPVVATRVGGVVDIIEDKTTGILTTPKDPAGMAEAIIEILRDNNLAKTLVRNARKKIEEKFSLELMGRNTLKVYEELASVLNILIIKISSLGDVILATPSIRAIRHTFPKAKIFCLVGKDSRQAIERCPYLDGLIVCDLKEKDKGIKGLLSLARKLRRYSFDAVIDLQNSRKSHTLSFLSTAPKRFGYDNGKWSFLLNNRLKENPLVLSPVEHQFRTLEMLGINATENHLEIWPSKEDEEYVNQILQTEWIAHEEQLVGINLAASRRWLTKCWPEKNIAALCDMLVKSNIRPVITGTEEDLPLAASLLKLTPAKPLNFVGKTTILQLACLIKKCGVFVSADSAPLHVAAAVGVPIVALFGPTSPARHMPSAKNFIVIKRDISCSPCYKPECKDIVCMKYISAKEVLDAIEKLIIKSR